MVILIEQIFSNHNLLEQQNKCYLDYANCSGFYVKVDDLDVCCKRFHGQSYYVRGQRCLPC